MPRHCAGHCFFRGRCFTVVDLLFSKSVFKVQNDLSDREVLW